MQESVLSSKYKTFKDSGTLPRRRPQKTWNGVIRNDLKQKKVSKDLVKDSNVSKSIKNHPTHANREKRLKET